MDNEDEIYEQAMNCINELVKEVIQKCADVADRNDYEKEWVLEMFKEKFNKAKKV